MLCTLFIAGNYICGKCVTNINAPEILGMIRFIVTTLCFLPFIKFNAIATLTKKDFAFIIIASFFGMFLYSYLFFIAVNYTSAINISLVNATTPILTLLTTSILSLTMPNLLQINAFILSFIGVALVITKGTLSAELLKGSYGELIMFFGAFSWVIYGLIIKNLMQKSSPLSITFLTSFFGGILLFAYAFYAQHISTIFSLTQGDWAALLYVGVIGTAITFLMYAEVVRTIGPKKANLFIFSAAPIASMLMAYSFFGTPINIWQIIGAFCVISALLLNG